MMGVTLWGNLKRWASTRRARSDAPHLDVAFGLLNFGARRTPPPKKSGPCGGPLVKMWRLAWKLCLQVGERGDGAREGFGEEGWQALGRKQAFDGGSRLFDR